ncbi:MAG: hypothetical protein L0229_12340 [Blastocatellia bacterium]|nr:hypothetical protein [Blastocatellia bacterium]
MLHTHKAIIQNKRLIWLEGEPEAIKKPGAVLVYVTIPAEGLTAPYENFERAQEEIELRPTE